MYSKRLEERLVGGQPLTMGLRLDAGELLHAVSDVGRQSSSRRGVDRGKDLDDSDRQTCGRGRTLGKLLDRHLNNLNGLLNDFTDLSDDLIDRQSLRTCQLVHVVLRGIAGKSVSSRTSEVFARKQRGLAILSSTEPLAAFQCTNDRANVVLKVKTIAEDRVADLAGLAGLFRCRMCALDFEERLFECLHRRVDDVLDACFDKRLDRSLLGSFATQDDVGADEEHAFDTRRRGHDRLGIIEVESAQLDALVSQVLELGWVSGASDKALWTDLDRREQMVYHELTKLTGGAGDEESSRRVWHLGYGKKKAGGRAGGLPSEPACANRLVQ